jgi:hypothetical protein
MLHDNERGQRGARFGLGRLDSIGLGIALLGFSYALCGLIPGLFIREKMFDPKANEPRGIAEPQPQAAAS